MAKQVELVAVKVLDEDRSGTFGDLLAGIDYVAGQKQNNTDQPMLAVISLEGESFNSLVNNAINSVVRSGVVVIVAAGTYWSQRDV